MCGSTGAQNTIQAEQMQSYTELNQLTQQEYGDQQAIYGPMGAQLQSIFQQGPSQEGMSAAEKNNLDSEAVAGTAQNYQRAAGAAGTEAAAEGGGNEYMPSGGATQLNEEEQTGAAKEESQQEQQITEQDYAEGRSNWEQAGQGLMSIAAGENPLGYANASTNSGVAAGNTANQVAQENNSWENAAIGAAGAIGGGFAGDFTFGGG
jgi:hypothetical protein